MSEQNSERAVLTYNLDEEYQIRIEEPKDFHESYFRDVYSQAAKAVTGIINQNIDPNGKAYPFAKETKEFNNIIAFVGGRGTGKTSCMVSFAKYLIGEKDKSDKSLDNFEIEQLVKHKFVSLPTIDPSLFENHENIIEVVLAQLFSEFESILNDRQRDIDQDIRRKLIELFDNVYRNLQTIIKGRSNYDGESLETLSKLSQSTKLRDNFRSLIHKFIKLKSKNEDAFLIIPIDDFDLNVRAASEMSEQIRKYFMIPNVIILMSVNIEQLRDAKELSIRNDFKGMIESMEDDPAQMAVEYLLKLIPDNRRYYMPEIKYNFNNTDLVRIIKSNKEPIKLEPINIDVYIFEQIFKTTGLIFVPKEENHILIPNNHRRLKELIFFLDKKMSLGNEYTNDNLIKFENYMTNNYLPSIIPKKYYKYFKNISNADIMQLNWTIIHTFHNIIADVVYKYNPELYIEEPFNTFPNTSSDLNDYTNELKELLTRANNPHNISLGDTLFIINLTDRHINTNEFKIFCESVKVVHSIKTYKSFKNKKTNEIKTAIGNSLLPCESLKKIVAFKNSNSSTSQYSRITFKYNNKNNKNEMYKNFVVYNGSNYLYRRRSSRDFFDGYGFDQNNDYILDILSCIVNTIYLSKEFKDLSDGSFNNKDSIAIEIGPSVIPFYSIDLIEKILYRSFRFTVKKELKNEIIDILNHIKKRIEKSKILSKYKAIQSFLLNNLNESYIFKTLIISDEFSSFIDELELNNKIVIKKNTTSKKEIYSNKTSKIESTSGPKTKRTRAERQKSK